MIILFSRHARRRAKLYGIIEEDVRLILKNANLRLGRQELLKEVESFRHPIKLIIDVEGDRITLITCYPLKKGVGS